MTILNFPPTAGEATDGSFTYESNGVLYSWDGAKWIANSESAFDDKYVNIDGDTMTGDLTVPSLNGGQLAGFRNQLINGGMDVWQRGTTFAGTANLSYRTYITDRWASHSSTAARLDGPFGYALSVSGPSSAGAGGKNQILQVIETPPGKAGPFIDGSTWTASVWLASTDTSATASIGFTDGVDGGNSQAEVTQTLVSTGETVATWVRFATTFTISGTPAATNNGLYLAITSDLGTAYFADIQIEPGPVATPFEHRPIGTELALCQRYFVKTAYLGISGPDGAKVQGTVFLPVPMRVAPTYPALSMSGGADIGLDVRYVPRSGEIGMYGTAGAILGSSFGANGLRISNATFDAEL